MDIYTYIKNKISIFGQRQKENEIECIYYHIISNNIDKLIATTTYDELMNLCDERGILLESLRLNVEDRLSREIRHKMLLENIAKRGPAGYNEFLNILEQSFPKAFTLLDNYCKSEPFLMNVHLACFDASPSSNVLDVSPTDGNVSVGNIKLKVFAEVLPSVSFTVKKSSTIKYSRITSTYRMESKYRGVAFIVNIINFANLHITKPRRGADIDRKNLVTLLREMGYTIFYYEDLTKADFLALIKELSQSPHLRRNESFILVVLSHGDRIRGDLFVEFHDHDTLNVEKIIEIFNNKNCPNLVGKPKLFMFPFCRGGEEDLGVRFALYSKNKTRTIYSDVALTIPTFSDIKILYGTLPGYVSYRSPNDGSHYITVLCEIWALYAAEANLDELLKLTDNKLREIPFDRVQVSSTEDRGFSQALYFNPGYVKPARINLLSFNNE